MWYIFTQTKVGTKIMIYVLIFSIKTEGRKYMDILTPNHLNYLKSIYSTPEYMKKEYVILYICIWPYHSLQSPTIGKMVVK